MYSLNYLKDVLRICKTYNLDPVEGLDTLERKVTQYIGRDLANNKYVNLMKPETQYKRGVAVIKEYYKRHNEINDKENWKNDKIKWRIW